jgi:asparagine synthase (glutamine-hydrolysing)
MSGLCALVDFSGAPADKSALLAMAAAHRRGPQGPISRMLGQAGLCHLPLRRERPAAGSPDGLVHAVADVRLDNRRELIDRLGLPGIVGEPGDADLLVAAYLRWGEGCLDHLLGDFAFVLWDARRRQLFCACDPMGVKPLCYARSGSLLCIASEAQQVLRHPALPRRLDEVAVGDFLVDGVSDPALTLFQGVLRLPAGHRLLATAHGQRAERWWTPDPVARTLYRRDEEYAARFLELFRRAVGDRLRETEGPVGILMSGGLDSTSVAALACEEPSEGSRPLFAASFLFDQLQECDERSFIQAVAADLGLETELVAAESFPVLGDPATRRPSLEAPFLAWDRCFREVLRRARDRGARVLLTGHGGDDLLSGSPLVYADRLRRGDLTAVLEIVRHAAAQRQGWRWILYHYLVQPLLPQAAERGLRRALGRASGTELPEWIDAGFARRTGLSGRFDRPRPGTARQAFADHLRQAPWDSAAHWYDQHAAAFGIEVRHPFLDRRLVEYLLSIPPDRLFRAGIGKPLLRQAMAGLLPASVRLRKDKTRLGAFLEQAIGAEWEAEIEQLLEAPLAAALGYVDGSRLRAAYRRFREGRPGRLDGTLWYPVALEYWLREHGTRVGMEVAA